MKYQKYSEPEEFEKKLSPHATRKGSTKVSKRGQIRCMSKKSSLELWKRTARSGELVLWIDCTFSTEKGLDQYLYSDPG